MPRAIVTIARRSFGSRGSCTSVSMVSKPLRRTRICHCSSIHPAPNPFTSSVNRPASSLVARAATARFMVSGSRTSSIVAPPIPDLRASGSSARPIDTPLKPSTTLPSSR